MSVFSKIKRWYLGGPLPLREETKDGSLTCRLPDTYEPSLSARIAQFLVGFWVRHWQYIISSAIALAIYFGFIAKP
jgi:hypothetical protein